MTLCTFCHICENAILGFWFEVKYFLLIKWQSFLIRLNLESSHTSTTSDIVEGVSNQSQINLFYILPLAKTTIHCVWLQNVIKVMIIKMWSWKRSTWSSQLTALLTQKWWLVDWCLDSIFHFSVGAQCQAVELFWKQKSHQMGFDLIVVSRGKSGIRICLKIS